MSGERRCEIRTTSDGTKVRVNGQISDERLDEITARVRAYVDSRCAAASPFVMPAIAQRIHGHETYTCGREEGHDGEHCWPDKPDAKWRWDTTPAAAQQGDTSGGGERG